MQISYGDDWKQTGICLELGEKWITKGHEENVGVMEIHIILIVGIVSQVCTYVKTYKIVYFKYEQIIEHQLYIN